MHYQNAVCRESIDIGNVVTVLLPFGSLLPEEDIPRTVEASRENARNVRRLALNQNSAGEPRYCTLLESAIISLFANRSVNHHEVYRTLRGTANLKRSTKSHCRNCFSPLRDGMRNEVLPETGQCRRRDHIPQ